MRFEWGPLSYLHVENGWLCFAPRTKSSHIILLIRFETRGARRISKIVFEAVMVLFAQLNWTKLVLDGL